MQPPDPETIAKSLRQKRTDPMSAEESWLREGYVNLMMGQKYVELAAVDDTHIWRPRWHPASIFVTDDLLAALKDAKVQGLHAERLGTRAEPLPTPASIREKLKSTSLESKDPSSKTEA
jgi:hypothetical protein